MRRFRSHVLPFSLGPGGGEVTAGWLKAASGRPTAGGRTPRLIGTLFGCQYIEACVPEVSRSGRRHGGALLLLALDDFLVLFLISYIVPAVGQSFYVVYYTKFMIMAFQQAVAPGVQAGTGTLEESAPGWSFRWLRARQRPRLVLPALLPLSYLCHCAPCRMDCEHWRLLRWSNPYLVHAPVDSA